MIKPIYDQILIKPIEENGILRGDEVSLCEYGEVLDVGNEVENIKNGDILAFTKWGTNSVEINGKKHYFLKNESQFILGLVIPE